MRAAATVIQALILVVSRPRRFPQPPPRHRLKLLLLYRHVVIHGAVIGRRTYPAYIFSPLLSASQHDVSGNTVVAALVVTDGAE